MLHFYDVEKLGTFCVPFSIFGASNKRGFPQENRDEWGPYAFGAAKKKMKNFDIDFLPARLFYAITLVNKYTTKSTQRIIHGTGKYVVAHRYTILLETEKKFTDH